MRQLTYSVADLHAYVDGMHDVSLMVADPQTKQYAPKGKGFLKSQVCVPCLWRLKRSSLCPRNFVWMCAAPACTSLL